MDSSSFLLNEGATITAAPFISESKKSIFFLMKKPIN